MKRKAPRRRFTAVDLFAGSGGLSAGLRRAGFRVLGAVEMDALAVKSYRMNHPAVRVWEMDIRKLSAARMMENLGLRRGELDLLAGCPPCQGFSTLRTWNGAKRNRDPRNNLLLEMLRAVRVFLPKAIMIENVPRVMKSKPFRNLCKALLRLGYEVNWAVKDAARYGVPQRRKRLILMAGRGFHISFASECNQGRTVRDAIGWMAKAGRSGDPLHDMPEIRSDKVLRLIRDIPKNGGSRLDLPRSRQLKCHKRCNGFKDIYGRMAWDDQAPTITSGCFNPSKGRFLHPEEDRAITMREAALLQSFPQDYRFAASAGKQAIALMIGNALPPEFVRRHALEILKALRIMKRGNNGHGRKANRPGSA
jgi:DNA (cytosine-5)-methyltransferase 1